jgi:hypothetical protein
MRSSLLLTGLLATFTSGCFYVDPGPGPSSDGTMTIDNGSSYVLNEVRITTVRSSSWGPNLLSHALTPNQQLTVSVACNTYDVLISDEYARDCVLSSVDLCFADKVWVIDNATLRNCAF